MFHSSFQNKKVLSFGELLLRICPDTNGEWLQTNTLPFYVGGAEANAATALALWNIPTTYLSVIPDNIISKQLIDYLNDKKIDASKMLLQGDKMGLYFLPKGNDLKHTSVIYDRSNSSFSQVQKGIINWDDVLKDVGWFHYSAISPAINQNVADVCKEALEAASKRNIVISVDLNYRAKLWQYGKEPIDVMTELVSYCNVVMGNLWSAEKMLGIEVDKNLSFKNSKQAYLDHAAKTSERIIHNFPSCKVVAKTFRFDAVSNSINYYATLSADNKLYVSKEYQAEKIADKVGSGDCFMAGVIYGLYNQHSYQDTLEVATAAAFSKLFIEGDATNKTIEEIKDFVKKYETRH
ncbi:MAG: PfkB family carbohydrate kinase [Ilyomonas sp.]